MLATVGFSPNYSLRCSSLMPPSVLPAYFVHPTVSVSPSSSWNWATQSKLTYIRRASAEGIPNELVEDSKFVPLNSDDPQYGPPALLLLGFEAHEASKIQQLLKDLDGEFMKVIYCTEEMVTCSLWEAMHVTQNSFQQMDKSLPRICFLSGLSGEEMMMFIDAFPETGLKPAVFAALVPNSANKPLHELIEEIMGDHKMLTGE